MDALNGIDNSILSVGVAVDRMNAAIVAAINGQTGPGVSGTEATIDRLYRSILGYGADSEGQKFWQSALANGAYSYSDLIAGLRAQAGADVKAKVPAFATGGVFTNSVVRRPTHFNMAEMGEAGPEGIMPLANVGGKLGVHAVVDAPVLDLPEMAMPVPGDSTAELRALRADVSGLMDGLRSIAKHTMQTARRVEFLVRLVLCTYWPASGFRVAGPAGLWHGHATCACRECRRYCGCG